MRKRPPIPKELERAVLVECGHRCAIPTCRQTPVELAHIVPWSQCKTHIFENLIALCPTCHTRFDRHEIDRKSMRLYKHNLLLKGSRYGDLEQRLLLKFARDKTADAWIMMELEILLAYLLEDGLLESTAETRRMDGGAVQKRYRLTKKGRNYKTGRSQRCRNDVRLAQANRSGTAPTNIRN